MPNGLGDRCFEVKKIDGFGEEIERPLFIAVRILAMSP
jgi:hypothetical protein